MSRSVDWEKALRRKLRKKGVRRSKSAWPVSEVFWLLFWTAIGIAFTTALVKSAGGVGLGLPCGLVGGFLGLTIRNLHYENMWLSFWGPAGHGDLRRIQMQGLFGMILWVVLPLAVAVWLAACFMGGMSAGMAAGAAATAFLTGFVMVWLRPMFHAAWIGLVCLVGLYAYHNLVSDTDHAGFAAAVAALPHLWLPSMPWSWGTMPVAYDSLQIVLVFVVFIMAIREAHRIWWEWNPPLVMEEMPGETAPDDAEPVTGADIMTGVRQSVHHAWFGMVGYLPRTPGTWFDMLVWRCLTPRERWLSCLGSNEAREWFSASLRGVYCLIALVLIFLLVPRPWVAAMTDRMPLVVFLVHGGLAIVAVYLLWPGRRSAFQMWLMGFRPEGLGQVPALSMLPVTGREWLRAGAKEWAVRSLWSGGLVGLAVAITLPVRVDALAGKYWLGLVPLALLLASFPASICRRVVIAMAGAMLADHGATRATPAMLAAVACFIATLLAAGCGIFGEWGYGVLAILVASCCGVVALRCALGRMEHSRFDQRPRSLP